MGKNEYFAGRQRRKRQKRGRRMVIRNEANSFKITLLIKTIYAKRHNKYNTFEYLFECLCKYVRMINVNVSYNQYEMYEYIRVFGLD